MDDEASPTKTENCENEEHPTKEEVESSACQGSVKRTSLASRSSSVDEKSPAATRRMSESASGESATELTPSHTQGGRNMETRAHLAHPLPPTMIYDR